MFYTANLLPLLAQPKNLNFTYYVIPLQLQKGSLLHILTGLLIQF